MQVMFRKAGQFVENRHNRRSADTDTDTSDDIDADADFADTNTDTDDVNALGISRRRFLRGREDVVLQTHTNAGGLQTRDVVALQKLWYRYAQKAGGFSMWRVLNALNRTSKTTQSAVLLACQRMLPRSQRHLWPRSRQAVDTKIKKECGSFFPQVVHSVAIDLSHHGLPELAQPIQFKFVDPIFAWACCARRLSQPVDLLHFKFISHTHPTSGERLYGGSVAHGEIMRVACSRVPTEPALIGLSLDFGQASKRRSYAPIILSVGNTDSRIMDACTCISYLPDLALGADLGKAAAQRAMHDLRQACMGAIIKVIEASGEHGFHCLLGGHERRLLFPVLCRMEFDTKERYKFFCCDKQRACGCGSGPRQGHSALRRCTPHASRRDLPAKRRAAADPASPNHEAAVKSLKRWGIHPHKQCTALMGLQYCVIPWPGRIHFGLYAYDIMHHLYINSIRYTLDCILDYMTPTQKRTLDARMRALGSFRNHQGVTCKRVSRLSTTGCLSAEMKVLHLFVWIHALGSQALLLAPAIRENVLVALTSLQIICYSVRGSRPYTEAEHRFIFSHVGRKFWRALSNLSHQKRQSKIVAAEAYNVGKPPQKRRRVPHWRPSEKDAEETSDTASSTDEDVSPEFLRSDKIVPHSFEHFADQVVMGGTHLFNDTSLPETSHKDNLGDAAARSRTYHDVNRSSDAMMSFNYEKNLLREICIQAKIDMSDGTTHSTIYV